VINSVAAFDPLAEVQDAALEYGGSIWNAAQFVSANPLELLIRFAAHEIQGRATELAAETLADEMAVDAVLGGEGPGTEIFLEMPELGAVGFARVMAIEPFPEVIDGPGRVVTATFRHQSAQVLDLAFAPLSGSKSETTTVAFNASDDSRAAASSFSLGVTSVHPFWSVDREDFVPAGELRPREQVLGIDGQHFRLTSITPRAGPETVYNFEVALDHVYYVGEGGLLVHNLYARDVVNFVADLGKRAGASAKLGRSLVRAGIRRASKQIAHHLIPIALTGKKELKGFFQSAAKAGWDVNGVKNGLFMAGKRHASHGSYNAFVEAEVMRFIKRNPNATGAEAKRFLDGLAKRLSDTLSNSNRHINELF
jgi:Pretoxin HINT domain/A nuclease family of the HNH/ENDO VII superfamily with conserved AHH